jgi:hypothetical protein
MVVSFSAVVLLVLVSFPCACDAHTTIALLRASVCVVVQAPMGRRPVSIAAVPGVGSTCVVLDAATSTLAVLQPGSATGEILKQFGGTVAGAGWGLCARRACVDVRPMVGCVCASVARAWMGEVCVPKSGGCWCCPILSRPVCPVPTRTSPFVRYAVLSALSGVVGSGNGALLNPSAVAVTHGSQDWCVLVADTGNDRVVEFTRQGLFVRWWTNGAPHATGASCA